MADLVNLYRILYHIYNANHEGKRIRMRELQLRELQFMHMNKELIPSLSYLEKNDYVEGPDEDLQLTGKGLQVTELLFRHFLTFMKRYYFDDLSYWINNLELYRESVHKLICNIYFYVEEQREPLMRSAFNEYLKDIGIIENVIGFDIKEKDLGTLVDEVFINLDEVNRLFQHKFNCKLFCPPVAACSFMSKAARAKEINFVNLVAVIGTVLGAVCQKEIEKHSSSAKRETGSISKIRAFLDDKGISYNAGTIEILKTLYRVRSTTYPLHETGSEIIDNLKKLNVIFPFDNYQASLKLLENLNLCLTDMKIWFV